MRLWRLGDPIEPLRALLVRGGVLAIPTESSYGLAADPRNPAGVEAIYRIKGRAMSKALPVVVADLAQLADLGIDPGLPILEALAACWPAPLTAVLPIARPLPAAGGAPTLAVRIPAHEGLRRLLAGLGHGLTATSANRSGGAPVLDPEGAAALLAMERDAAVVDGGVLPGGLPSTLVAIEASGPVVLRTGSFPVERLRERLGDFRQTLEKGRMKHSILGLIAILGIFALPAAAREAELPPGAAPAIAGPSALPIIGVDEIRPGQKGYGLSVFTGTEPERFDVEIVGVMRNASPELNYILARLNGKGLERSGVASGMSGSPVFIDGKLAGAVAFSWPFSHDAIAGIMPIESMRRLSTLGGGIPPVAPPPPVELADLRAGRIPKDLLQRELSRLQPKVALDARASVHWAIGGFGEQSQALLRTALGSAAPAGRAAGGGSEDLILGGAVAAVLAEGDFQMAAIGTVTDRYDDQVLAFGHPVLGLGPIRVPMATAEVVHVLSNSYSSFKISNLGQTIGAFEQDRQAGMKGRIGQTAQMTPVTVRIAGVGGKPREYHSRIADVPQFTPMLIGSSVLAGLDSASYTAGAQSIDLDARFRLRGHGDLRVRQSFDGDSAGVDVAGYVLAIAGYLVQNPLEQVAFEEVEIDVKQSPQPRAATLVGANADRTVVRPGDTVGLSLDLVAWRGERFRRSMRLTLPEDLPAGRYSLIVGDGSSVDAARLALEPTAPVTFPQALDFLRAIHSRRDLMVLGVYGGPGLSVAGEIMPRLPGSVRSLWSAAASGSATPLRVTIAQEHREEVDVPVDGAVRIDLEVRRRDPVVGGEGDTAAPAGEKAVASVQTR